MGLKYYRPYYVLIYIAVFISFSACKQRFEPDGKTVVTNFLVVEGIINCGNDSTTITLSRTVPVGQKQTAKLETGASLSVESTKGTFYNLTETKKGTYQSAPLNLSLTDKYRLNIKTADGKIYQSDFVEAKTTPPVEEIPYERTADGLTLKVNTRDVNNNTRYYRWSYEETWKFHSALFSSLESTGNAIIPRVTPIYTCYRTERSTTILLASTLKLTEDVVLNKVLTSIPNRSDRISDKYSINVKQHALTKEGYEFWENQRKNTEQLGGVFDPQPSELNGNIHCITNSSEPVVGFVSVCTEARKRIFITPDQVNWQQPLSTSCNQPDTIKLADVKAYFYFEPGKSPAKIPADAIYSFFGSIIAYTGGNVSCVDCRLRGTTQVPPFWQ